MNKNLESYMYLNNLPNGSTSDPSERIVCAANKYGDVILCGVRHGSDDMFSLADFVEKLFITSDLELRCEEQGFLTSKYRFVSRKEAWKIALEQRQIVRLVGNQTPDSAYEETELYSENLY